MHMLGSGEHYALEVAGDSMVEAGILDGDTVIIRRIDAAETGQIVVALVDDTEVTLKRLRRRGNSIALEPCNVRHETRIFPADRVKVQGTAGRAAAALLSAMGPWQRSQLPPPVHRSAESGPALGNRRHRQSAAGGRHEPPLLHRRLSAAASRLA